jgi:hypothetical protein
MYQGLFYLILHESSFFPHKKVQSRFFLISMFACINIMLTNINKKLIKTVCKDELKKI